MAARNEEPSDLSLSMGSNSAKPPLSDKCAWSLDDSASDDYEEAQDCLYLIPPPKENKAHSSLQSTSLLGNPQCSLSETMPNSKYLTHFLSDSFGRSQLDARMAKEEERYWRGLDAEDDPQQFNIEQTCSMLRSRVFSSLREPLPASYNHVILRLIEALEKATVKLEKVEKELSATREELNTIKKGMSIQPVWNDRNLSDLVGKGGSRSPHPTEESGKIRVLDISISATQRPDGKHSTSEQPTAPTARASKLPAILHDNLLDLSNIRRDREKNTESDDSLLIKKQQPVKDTVRSYVGLDSTTLESSLSSSRIPHNNMAAVASKFESANAKHPSNPHLPLGAGPQHGCQLNSEHGALLASNEQQANIAPRSLVDIQKPVEERAYQKSSQSYAAKPQRQRSQSEVQDHRRFSFMPGDDSNVATFTSLQTADTVSSKLPGMEQSEDCSQDTRSENSQPRTVGSNPVRETSTSTVRYVGPGV